MQSEKFTVIGFKHSTGTFNGNEYDNYNIHCLKDADKNDKEQGGQLSEVFKIKSSEIKDLPAIGQVIAPIYDKYGRVVGFENA